MLKTYKGMEIFHTLKDGAVIVCYNQFAVQNRYKILKRQNDTYRHVYSTDSPTEALSYAKKIYV